MEDPVMSPWTNFVSTSQLLYLLWKPHYMSNVEHFKITVKPVLSGHSKIDKTKVLKTNGSLMKV